MFEDILEWPLTKEQELNEEDMKAIAEDLLDECKCNGEEESECDGTCSCPGCGHGPSITI